MIAKGHHFPGVTLVGVINADLALHMPDFRAAERTFQLLIQVAGRAGRGETPGEVIIQTFTPEHPAIEAARTLNYDGFLEQELAQRQELNYPPFSRMMCITIENPDETAASSQAESFLNHLRAYLPQEVSITGPSPAPLARVKGRFRHQIMLRSKSPWAIQKAFKAATNGLRLPRKMTLTADMDAFSML